MTKTYEIDATHKALGRVASEAAMALMGKKLVTYTPNKLSNTKVQIKNASKVKIHIKKMKTHTYQNYSGYPGGQRIETLERLAARKGYGEVIRLAVERMMPRNTMRRARLKNLTISE